MKTVILSSEELFSSAAAQVASALESRPGAVIALAGGRTMKPLFRKLCELCRSGELTFKNAHILSVAEFTDAPEDIRIGKQIYEELISETDIPPENFHTPDRYSPEGYDSLIEDLGGIDLAVLGIGYNGHLGYNEPATPFDTLTHVQKLTDKTKAQLKAEGLTDDELPQYAVTMGIKTLTKSRDIAVIATGEDKSAAVFQMLYAKTTSFIPAAFLQLPLNVTVYCDGAAASRL